MRVLHLNTDGWREHEGIARVVCAIAERVDAEHHLVAERPSGEVFHARHRIPVHPWKSPFTGHLADVLARVKPDVMHVHGGGWAPALAWAPALRHVPVVASVYSHLEVPGLRSHRLGDLRDTHGSAIPSARTAAIALTGTRLGRLALRTGRTAAIVTPDVRIASALRGAGPVILARGAAMPSTRSATWSDEPTIVFAGRAETGRGVDDVVEAFHLVRRSLPRARLQLLLLPGSASERWRGLDEDGVTVRIEPIADLTQEFAACQLAMVAFRVPMTITPPLVAAEAMSVGLPVVSTDVGCLAALVHPGNGATVPVRSPRRLADEALRILCDRATWERLAAGARKTVAEDWHWNRAADGAAEAYAIATQRATQRATQSAIHSPARTVRPPVGPEIAAAPRSLVPPLPLDKDLVHS